jgi:cell division protein FtsL
VNRLSLVLLLALMASAMYLVKTSYEARRAFADLERPRPRSASWPPTPCGWRPSAAAKAHLRVERDAREAAMRLATPDVTLYVNDSRGPAASSATTGAAP